MGIVEGGTLFIIPARGGSKRLPRKNLMSLGGRPLIAWTIEAARTCGIIGTVCVSTDDEELASVARAEGAETPFMRPTELATDTASSSSVVSHALDYYRYQAGKLFDFVALLQPTSPFRDAEDIYNAFELRNRRSASNIVSVCALEHSPLWSNILPNDGSLRGFIREDVKGKRSQDLPIYYRLNGAIYLCKTERFFETRSLLMEDESYAYVMTQEHSVDIDSEFDLLIARSIIEVKRDVF